MAITYLSANRSIGLGFVRALAQRPDVKIYATARNPAKADRLKEVAETYGNVVRLKWDSDSAEEDSAEIARVVKADGGRLDVLIANAGFAKDPATVAAVQPSSISHHIKGNVEGTIYLFQALHPFLEACQQPGGGLLFAVSSIVGSIAFGPNHPNLAYSVAKVALNMVGKKISVEHPKIKVIMVHPGLVKTDGATNALAAMGLDINGKEVEAFKPITIEQSIEYQLAIIDKHPSTATGSFLNYDGNVIGW